MSRQGANKSYTYDARGNRATMTAGTETTTYTYDLANHLLKHTVNGEDTVYGYSQNGNQTTAQTGEDTASAYTYNQANQFIDASGTDTDGTYTYYPDGMRKSRVTGDIETTYVWDGDRLVLEIVGGTTYKYIWGLNLVSQVRSSGAYYYQYDGHGNVVKLINYYLGMQMTEASYSYDTFGNEVSPDAADVNPFRYCGEYYDASTGLYYLRARNYSPKLGRFTQEDIHWNPGNMLYGDSPIVLSRGAMASTKDFYLPDILAIRQHRNPYVYCVNNPVLFDDSNGEAIMFAPIIVGAVVGGAINVGMNIYDQLQNGTSLTDIKWGSVGVSFLAGAASGAIAGSPVGLLGQIGCNAVIGGTEAVLQYVVYEEEIDWKKVALKSGISALAGFAGGRGAQAPTKTTYYRLVSGGGNFSAVSITFSKRVTAEAAMKELLKGMTKATATQVFIDDKTVTIMYEE